MKFTLQTPLNKVPRRLNVWKVEVPIQGINMCILMFSFVHSRLSCLFIACLYCVAIAGMSKYCVDINTNAVNITGHTHTPWHAVNNTLGFQQRTICTISSLLPALLRVHTGVFLLVRIYVAGRFSASDIFQVCAFPTVHVCWMLNVACAYSNTVFFLLDLGWRHIY